MAKTPKKKRQRPTPARVAPAGNLRAARPGMAPREMGAATPLHRSVWLWGGALLLLSVVLRVVAVDHIPGINGDEASTSVLVRDFLQHRSGRSPFVTPTGRYNPLYILPLFLPEKLGWASAWALRLPGVIFGTALAVGGAWVAKKTFRQPAVALGAALWMACLPIHITYSRLGGDCAQVSLSTLFPVYYMLQRRWVLSLIWLAVAVLVHPLSIFLLPLALLAVLFDGIPGCDLSRSLKKWATSAVLVGCIACVAYLKFKGDGAHISTICLTWENCTWERVSNHLIILAQVFSGANTFAYFAGEPTAAVRTGLLAVGGAQLLGLVWAVWRMALSPRAPIGRRLVPLGTLLGMLMYFCINAYQEVGTERYLLVFTVPLILSVTLALDEVQGLGRRTGLLVCALGTALLLCVYLFYFQAIRQARGNVHPTYVTGPEDPKFAAYAWAVADAQRRTPDLPLQLIIADGWWTYWPLRYLAVAPKKLFSVSGQKLPSRAVRIYYIPSSSAAMPPQDMLADDTAYAAVAKEGAYAIGFTHGAFERIHRLAPHLAICATHDLLSYSGQPAVTVWRYCGPADPQEFGAKK